MKENENITSVKFEEQPTNKEFRVLLQQSVSSNTNSHEIGNDILIADWKKRQYDKGGFTLPASAQALYLYAKNRKSHSRSLFSNMKKGNSNLEKSVDKHAHHIVAAKDRRAEPSRRIMFGHGIGINDRCNGVYLFKAGHSQMHTNLYYADVNLQMEEIKSKGAKIVRNLLTRIGAKLKIDAIQASKL